MNHHIVQILRKNPSHLISHVGTNDASSSTAREILNKLFNLKSIAKDNNPDSEACLPTPTMRTYRGKGALTVSHLTNHLLRLEITSLITESNQQKSKS